MTVSFYLKRPKAEYDTSIYAILFYEGYRLKYYTPEKINPNFWNSEGQKAKQSTKFKEHAEFNQRLKNLKSDVSNIYRKWVNDHGGTIPHPDTLKELLNTELDKHEIPKGQNTFLVFFEQIAKRTSEGGRINQKTKQPTVHNTAKGYTSTLNHLKNFQKKYRRKIDFAQIDLDFYNDYVNYLTREVKLSINTIGDHIKRIKTVMNEATEKGINKNMAYRSKYFVKPGEQSNSIYLTADELKAIERLEIKNQRLENVRDLFLIGCYTGLRYSDFSILKPEHINDGLIRITQTKTGRPVVIPVHPTVKQILDKYNGQLPKSISNQKTNDYLKELGQLQPQGKDEPVLNGVITKTITKGGLKVTTTYKKWELLTTHTARRSFATNEYKLGTPSITIMAITGHRTEKSFLGYIKVTPDEHARILQNQWLQRNKLKAV